MSCTDSEFNSALKKYTRALKVLKDELAAFEQKKSNQKSGTELSAEICLDVFIARDEIQRYLRDRDPSIRKFLPELSQLDKQLKEQIATIEKRFPLAEWRKILDPPTSAWWWQGEAPDIIHPWDRLDWLWELLTIPTLTINFALVVSISSRFLAGGPDALGAIAVVGQSVVAMLAAGAPLTQAGQKIIEQVLEKLGLPKYLWHEAKLGIAILAFLSLFGLQNSLPNIARIYLKRGITAKDKFPTSALADYKRAIELDPNNMEAHYRLGAIYEELLEFDKANSEYRIAMLGGCVEAYNNLGRLYIVEEGDAAKAAVLLTRAQNKVDDFRCTSDTDVKSLSYSLLKNLGWARFIQKRHTEARNYLEEAIKLNPEKAAPYCLLAQVIEEERDESHIDALTAWESCLDYANRLSLEEDKWLYMAEQRRKKASSD